MCMCVSLCVCVLLRSRLLVDIGSSLYQDRDDVRASVHYGNHQDGLPLTVLTHRVCPLSIIIGQVLKAGSHLKGEASLKAGFSLKGEVSP